MRGERIASQPEATRAIVLEGSPCCGRSGIPVMNWNMSPDWSPGGTTTETISGGALATGCA